MKLLKAPRARCEPMPEVITNDSVTGLLLQWFDGENESEVKSALLTPFVIAFLQREHHDGRITERQLFDAVLGVLVQQAQRSVGFASVEYIGGERRDRLRENQ